MKTVRVLAVAAIVIMLTFTPALAGFYAGFQIGPNFATGSNTSIDAFGRTYYPGNPSFDTGFMVGVQGGYDFLNTQRQFPAWTKYLTLAVDYQYNPLNQGDWKGNQNALAFLAIFKYPMKQSERFPNGRLFPYVGAGPAIVWTSIEGAQSNGVGVVVEPGVRFMFTPKVSGDVAYRFRYAQPKFSNEGIDTRFDNVNHSVVFRVSYHF